MPTEPSILIIAEPSKAVTELHSGLAQKGFAISITSYSGKEVIEMITEQAPDLVLLGTNTFSEMKGLSQQLKQERRLPIIALVNRETLDTLDTDLDMDDFIVTPCDVIELVLRVKHLLRRTNCRDNSELIKCDDLVIDLAKCEVTLDNKPVVLTFREYELLNFLAKNKERVFTREVLLDKVWGYDYYGGDRTVDVHIRRLRSKIEDSSHTFIETVRNIGYRFREYN